MKLYFGLLTVFSLSRLPMPVFAEGNVENTYFVGEGDAASLSLEKVGDETNIYVAHKNSAEPFSGAKVYVAASSGDPVEAKETSEKGVYRLTLANNLEPTQVIVQTEEIADTVELSVPAYKKSSGQAAPTREKSMVRYTIAGLSIFLLLLGLGVVSYFTVRRKKKVSSAVLLAAFLFGNYTSEDAFAHGGHDHGGGQPALQEMNSGSDIVMSKKSQFLIGLRTTEAKSEDVAAVMKSFGHIIPPPENDALIVAPQPGFLKLTQNLKLGKKVKRGEVLGHLQTINQIALVSPIDGILAEMYAFNGARVEGGGKIFRVLNPEVLWVDAELFANQVTRLSEVTRAFVHADGFSKDIEAKLVGASTPISEETRTAKVYLELIEPTEEAKVGAFVDVRFELKSGDGAKAIAIPRSAVLSRAGEPVIFVQTGSETFSVRSVAYEESSRPGVVLVKQGIAENERVVVVGSYQLLMKVK